MILNFNRVTCTVGMLLALAVAGLQGCAVAIVGGAAEGTMIASERRSLATQWADQKIELLAAQSLTDALNRRGHVSFVSYYRKVLLTGEVQTAEDRERAQAAVVAVPDVAEVINELEVMPESSLLQRSNDTLITSKVKATLLNTYGVPGNSIKVVTDRSTVYLMGRLSRRETELATETVRTISGVARVVRVIDFISEQAALHPDNPGDASASAPNAGAPAPEAPASPAPADAEADVREAVTHPVQ
ncbi:MAG: BON domain-containing protein [Burkholderiaceae bacterium]|jgi:osmotically-inducible protein OsmY|nr:BON domain-containing protein [Burkholderiaceae bacterium]